jgi:uncharacterized protein YbjT (DUF2867 family)
MSEKTATLIGATGMTGNYLLQELLADNHFTTIRLLVRRPYPKSNPKMEVKLVDFGNAESFKLALEGTDTIFCTIGTTQQNVKGDKQLYRSIDFDIPVNAARFGKEAGCNCFVLVSAIGANPKSNNFYLQLKGQTEEAIKAVNINSLYILRPSLLVGNRKEKRMAEAIAKGIMKGLSFLLPSKYKAIHGNTVARAMLMAATEAKQGTHIFTYTQMKEIAIL